MRSYRFRGSSRSQLETYYRHRGPPAGADDDIEDYVAHDNSPPLMVKGMFFLYSSIGRRGKIYPCTTMISLHTPHHLDPPNLFDGSIVLTSNGRLPELNFEPSSLPSSSSVRD